MAAPLEVPQPVLNAVRSHPGCGGEFQFAIHTDVRSDGSFGEEWLVVTAGALYILQRLEDSVEVSRYIPLNTLESLKAETMVGGGVLYAMTKEQTAIELLRYSGSQAKVFGEVAGAVEKYAKTGNFDLDLSAIEQQFCPKCGRRLTEGSRVCPNCLDHGRTFKRLMAYVRPYRAQTVLLVCVLTVITAAQMLPPYVTKMIIDDVLTPATTRGHLRQMMLTALVLILAGAYLLRHLLTIFSGRISGWLGNSLTYDIRREVFRSLQHLSLSYFDGRQTGAVMSRVNHDTQHLHSFLVNVLPFGIHCILMVLGIGAILFVISWKITLFILMPIPLLVWIGRTVWQQLHTSYARYFERRSRLNATVGDSLWGIRVVKAFSQEGREIDRFGEKNLDFREAGVALEQKWAFYMPAISFVTMSGTMIVWYVGSLDVIAGGMTLGALVWYVGNLAMFYGPVQTLTNITNYLSNALTSAERVFEILDTEPDIVESEDAVDLGEVEGNIEMQHVTFGYNRFQPVIEDFSLKIEAGETIGLVGRSGSGKSTIMNLICRFYDVQEGRVLIDGVDIRNVRKDCLGRSIGVVLQETFLFDGTVAENISYGRPESTLLEIIQSAKAANAHDFIVSFPDGYDTRVGERGGKLSLGERQRVSIARAILNDPRILILDEATSSVDTETEKQIQQALERLTRDRTTLVIAHRLSTLRNADRIVVVHEGKLAECGRHDELMRQHGLYYWLITAQEVFKE